MAYACILPSIALHYSNAHCSVLHYSNTEISFLGLID